MIFFIFLKLFLRSAHQNDPKHIKKLIFNKKKIKFFENTGWLIFPNARVIELKNFKNILN
jgi:hypothetical protein